MTTGIFDNQEYLVSMDLPSLAEHLARKTGQPKTKETIEIFFRCPQKDGLSFCLNKDASIFLCVTNLLFGENFKLGSHIWVYFTETQEWACLQETHMKPAGKKKNRKVSA